MKTNCLKQTTKSNLQFIKQNYAIKEAKALTRTTRELYDTLLWFQRGKDNCFPGYEKIMKRSDIRSKVTISLHLKVLIKVGLVKRERRGKMQSNIYYVVKSDELTNEILKELKRPHKAILREIKDEMEKERNIREAKRELKSRRFIRPRRERTASNPTYPHKSEVQQMYSNISSNEDINIYSSNLNNDSKLKNDIQSCRENESRGGGFKKFSELILQRKTHAPVSASRIQNEGEGEKDNELFVPKPERQKKPLEALTGITKIRHVMLKISEDIHDFKHKWENVTQAINIFKKIQGVDENKYIDTLWNVRGLTIEIINYLDRPGAYFFRVLRDRWQLS